MEPWESGVLLLEQFFLLIGSAVLFSPKCMTAGVKRPRDPLPPRARDSACLAKGKSQRPGEGPQRPPPLTPGGGAKTQRQGRREGAGPPHVDKLPSGGVTTVRRGPMSAAVWLIRPGWRGLRHPGGGTPGRREARRSDGCRRALRAFSSLLRRQRPLPGSVVSPTEPSPEPPPQVVWSSIKGACVRGSSPSPGPRLPFSSSFSLDELASFLFSAMEFCSVFLALQSQRNPRQQMPIRSV
ncbi:TPA: hypothetical protein BOS_11712 [Bos taurus]|nr:TPA: hypothetical protein BOS_11712 [Bos taurus]